MIPIRKINLTKKKEGVTMQMHDFEYDITNDEGKTFHVTVHREITTKAPVLEH